VLNIGSKTRPILKRYKGITRYFEGQADAGRADLTQNRCVLTVFVLTGIALLHERRKE